MRKIVVLFVVAFCLLSTGMRAQHTFVHKQSSTYEWPEDSLVLKKLDQWRDLKFGVIFHWGLYAVPGIVESWALCSEDVTGSVVTVTITIKSLRIGIGTD